MHILHRGCDSIRQLLNPVDCFTVALCLVCVQVVLHPTPNSPKQSELHKMALTKACPDHDLKIKLAIRMDKPQNMKHSG